MPKSFERHCCNVNNVNKSDFIIQHRYGGWDIADPLTGSYADIYYCPFCGEKLESGVEVKVHEPI